MATTTKVSAELRGRINRDAQECGVTAAGVIERLLDAHEQRQRTDVRSGEQTRRTGTSSGHGT